ncbi:hypothetical protein [Kitasatospora sp. MBT63]|uniref:hypothetical protein n=1 Tax=Kitasatospora sp. MBT63 TaxID=1444768 RepID=UPI0011EA6C4E|nr:hypothetical protein [Kitasatospora sp. MBT63]
MKLPLPLVNWHNTIKDNPQGYSITRPIEFNDIKDEFGFVTFLVESQGCWEWSYKIGDDDPEVFYRDPSSPTWEISAKSLSAFLKFIHLREVLESANHWAFASGINQRLAARITSSLGHGKIYPAAPYVCDMYQNGPLVASVEPFDQGSFTPPDSHGTEYSVTIAAEDGYAVSKFASNFPEIDWRMSC